MLLILSGVLAIVLSGCGVGTQNTSISDVEAWRSSQKSEFLEILENRQIFVYL